MPASCPTTQATWIYAIYNTLEHHGFDSETLFAEQGVQLNMFNDIYQNVPKALVNSLWKLAIEVTENDAFCLSILDFFNTTHIEKLVASAKSSQNIHQALEGLANYHKLITPEIELTVALNDELQIKITHNHEGEEWLPEVVDLTFALIKHHGVSLTGYELKPTQLLLSRSLPKQHQKYRDFFGCPIKFNAPHSMICFPLNALNSTIPSANQDEWIEVEEDLSEKNQLQAYRQKTLKFNLRVRRYLFENLGQNFPCLTATASHFHMSISAFKKHLSDEGFHFQLLSDEIRKKEACRLISKTCTPLKQVAYKLGFSNTSVFNRAFKRWTKVSPNEYRTQNCDAIQALKEKTLEV